MKCDYTSCVWNDSYKGCIKPKGRTCPRPLLEQMKKQQTNADCIRAMSDEELAAMFADHENRVAFEVCCSFGLPSVDYDFEESTSELLEWLKQPAEG